VPTSSSASRNAGEATGGDRSGRHQNQFDDRNAPGLNHDHPGYEWGAGHAMELAYMWPSFDNGIPLAAQFTPAQRQLSDEMVRYWGAFTRFRAPFVPRQASGRRTAPPTASSPCARVARR
jgi:carboxylesterase type B